MASALPIAETSNRSLVTIKDNEDIAATDELARDEKTSHPSERSLSSGIVEDQSDITSLNGQISITPEQVQPRGENHNLQTLECELAELKQRLVSIEATNQKYKQELHTLRGHMLQKTAENRRLHDIIVQSASITSDLTEQEVRKCFSDMKLEIGRFLRQHVEDIQPRTPVPAFDTWRRNVQETWIEGVIGRLLWRKFFDTAIFGLPTLHEKGQQALEKMLTDAKVPTSQIDSWRSETIHAVSKLDLTVKLETTYKVARHIVANSVKYVIFKDRADAVRKMHTICQMAYDVALSLRGAKRTYLWRNDDVIDEAEADCIVYEMSADGEGASHGPPIATIILFGPVYKMKEAKMICIRQGELMTVNS